MNQSLNLRAFYPVSNHGAMGEAFDDKAACQAYCDSMHTQDTFYWVSEQNVNIAESTRGDIR